MKTSESRLRASRKWKSKHRPEIKEYKKRWKEKNKEHIREYQEGWRGENGEHLREYEREYRSTHPDVMDGIAHRLQSARNERKNAMVEKLGGCCAVCGYRPQHLCEMDIHEVNGRIAGNRGAITRSATTPGVLISTPGGFAFLMEHIDELVLLCANCHHKLNCGLCRGDAQKKIDRHIEGRK